MYTIQEVTDLSSANTTQRFRALHGNTCSAVRCQAKLHASPVATTLGVLVWLHRGLSRTPRLEVSVSGYRYMPVRAVKTLGVLVGLQRGLSRTPRLEVSGA